MDLKSKIKQAWPAIAILVVAAAARLTLLGIKPPHFDEGVNGWFVDQITHNGFYHYDPTNYHGPLHFYVLFLAQTLLGRHVWALRLPLALMSLATVYFTMRFDRFIGRGAALWAAAAMAVSPGCVFYGRYAIHEYWLVFSLMLCAWGLAGMWRFGDRKYLWAVWIGVTGAVLTKETYVIHFACVALTLPCVWVLGMLSPPADSEEVAPQRWTWRDMALGALMFAGCVVFFYSGTFMDMRGLKGLYETFHAWAKTGKVGNGHEKEWYYWLQLFGRYEWPTCAGLLVALLCVMPRTPRFVRALAVCGTGILLAYGFIHRHDEARPWCAELLTWPYLLLCAGFLVAMLGATPRTPRFIRALAIYGCGTLTAYSIIHYKTPWCVVSLTWPFLLLFGWGVDFVLRRYARFAAPVAGLGAAFIFRKYWRTALQVVTHLVGASLLGGSLACMLALNFFHFTDAKEPYVYVQTFEDIDKLMKPLNVLLARNPANNQLTGHIMVESYHPLPWLLGDFSNVGYYDDDTTPPKMDADFLLVGDTRIDDVERALREEYFTAPLRIRDAQEPSKLYLNVKKFQSVFPGRKPDFEPPPEAPGKEK